MRDKSNLTVETSVVEGLKHLKVCDLFLPNGSSWDIELLEEIFSKRDVREISSILIHRYGSKDKLIWSRTSNGTYTVKTGYAVCLQSATNMDEIRIKGDWSLIWKLKVLHKVKNLVWRVARDYLPTRVKLLSKHVLVPMTCDSCVVGIENAWHVFIHCPYALECWREAGIYDFVQSVADTVESFSQWLFKVLANASYLTKGKSSWFCGEFGVTVTIRVGAILILPLGSQFSWLLICYAVGWRLEVF